jgi:hypothetical protein
MTAFTPPIAELRRCGCCDRDRPAGKVAELGNTPGVYICAGCALWAARRAGLFSALADLRYPGRRLLRSWRSKRSSACL